MTTMTTHSVQFTAPLPGLGAHTSFSLDRIDGVDGLYALRAASEDLRLFLLDIEEGDYCLAAADGSSGDAAYRPPLGAGVRAQIGAADESEVRVFVVANPAADGVSVNLRAPIVLHRHSGLAAQLILDDQKFPIRAMLAGMSR